MSGLINGLFLQADAAPSSSSMGGLITFAPLLAVFAILYFVMIRPEQKKQKAKEKRRKEMLANLQKGDKVVSIGGIWGTVVSVKEKTTIVKVDDDTKLEFSKEAISDLAENKKAEEDNSKTKKEKSDQSGKKDTE